MVDQEPAPPPHAHHRLLTTARMEHAWWARNLTAPYAHTTADMQTHEWARNQAAPPTHATAYSQRHAWSIPCTPLLTP